MAEEDARETPDDRSDGGPRAKGRLRVAGTLTIIHEDGTVDAEEVTLEGPLKEDDDGR